MTEPKKTDHWNSLLDEIGVPGASPGVPQTTESSNAEETRNFPPSDVPPVPAPQPRERPKPRQEPKPAAKPSKSSWSSLLGALGLAPAEEPSPPIVEPPLPERVQTESPRIAEEDHFPDVERNPLEEFKPRYKPDEPPFPSPQRRRDFVDDVAPDIDLDADFGPEPDIELPAAGSDEPLDEVSRETPRGDREPQRRGRRRRRRRGRQREEGGAIPPLDRRNDREADSVPPMENDLDLEQEPECDLEIEHELFEAGSELSGSDLAPPAEERREGGRRRRRRRRGSGDRDAAPRDEGEELPARRRSRAEEIPARSPDELAPPEPDLEDELADVEVENEPGGEHAVHKKIPTWAETVGILIDANIAARSSRQPDRDRNRGRRPRRDR